MAAKYGFLLILAAVVCASLAQPIDDKLFTLNVAAGEAAIQSEQSSLSAFAARTLANGFCTLTGSYVAQEVVSFGSGVFLTYDYELVFVSSTDFEYHVTATATPDEFCPTSNTVTWKGIYTASGSSAGTIDYDFLYCSINHLGCLICGDALSGTSPYSFSSDCSLLTLGDFYDNPVTLEKSGLSAGAIVGIVICVLVVVGAAAAGIVFFVKRQNYQELA